MTRANRSHHGLRLAAVLILAGASSQFASPVAEAGAGVRLQFGGPLGSFVAHPTPAYGSASHTTPSKVKCAKTAPRAKDKPAHTVAPMKLVARTSERSRAKLTTALVARATETAKPDIAASALRVRQASSDRPTETAWPAAVSGSSALTAGRLPPSLPLTAIAPTETLVALPPPAATIAETADDGDFAVQSARTAQLSPAVTTDPADTAPAECKKFIPAVGVTISIGCND